MTRIIEDKNEEKNYKNKKKNQSAIECDLPYQKIIKEKKEGEKNK